jgi:hypothetical protein
MGRVSRMRTLPTLGINYVECLCSDSGHVIRLVSDFEAQELYMEFHLSNYLSFWGRVKEAVSYIFGKKSKSGCFDCTVLDPHGVDVLLKTLLAHQLACQVDQTSAAKIKKALKLMMADPNVYTHKDDMKKKDCNGKKTSKSN